HPASGTLEEIPAEFRYSPPNQEAPIGGKVHGDILVRVIDFHPNAQMKMTVKEGSSDPNPAVKIALQGSRAQMEEWLFAREYERQRANLGPAAIQFLEIPRTSSLISLFKDPELRGPVLSLGDKIFPLKTALGQEIPYRGGKLIPKNFFPDGVVYQGQLLGRSKELINPVALITWEDSKGKTQDFGVFSKHSHMGPVPLKQGDMTQPPFKDLRLFYIPPQLGSQENELVLAKLDSGEAVYSLRSGGKWGPVQSWKNGSPVKTGWMDFTFSISNIVHRAEAVHQFRPVSVPPGKDGPPPAVHLQLARGGEFKDFWLGRGQSKQLDLGNEGFQVAYALKSVPLGFTVKLRDFKIKKYEGTEDPASYESEVTLLDEGQGIREEHLISMNEPLAHRGFKIFQASYQLGEGGPDWSVFSVAYDPGVPIKYLGSIVLILGIIIIFYFRKAYSKNPGKVKDLAKENVNLKINPIPLPHE
ncbi:MAG: cytochrome c biogenesis protein ResB, partial [bacterium]|nr:cytochrome c biogenesis protein ResB [bacterium]